MFSIEPSATEPADFWNVLRGTLANSLTGSPSSPLRQTRQLDALSEVPVEASVRVLRNFSFEPLLPWLRLAGYKRGIRIDVEMGDFDVLHQELIVRDAPANAKPYQAFILAVWLDAIATPKLADLQNRMEAIDSYISNLIQLATQSTRLPIIVNTVLPPIDVMHRSDVFEQVDQLNAKLRSLSSTHPQIVVADIARLAQQAGWRNCVDQRLWQLYKAPLATALLRGWSELLAQALAAHFGRARKVLVLDCDDTLWGGLVGEDGVDGIQLNSREYPGAVFQSFQQQILQLHKTGVLIALCSKNNEADVFAVLRNHPDCLLRPEHLAAWRINWNDKAQSVCELASELNVGLDSFCLIDNSPAECDRIRQALPMVDVLQIPSTLAELPYLLEDYSNFWTPFETEEDRNRTTTQQVERQRNELRRTVPSLEEYLSSLQQVAEIGAPTPSELPRLAQLISKTNQFNLTTRRHSAAELRAFNDALDTMVICMKVRDRFGDHGLVGLAIASVDDGAVLLDTFLLSCRVLGRQLEDALLAEITGRIRDRFQGLIIRGEYRRTAKNIQCQGFFDRHGFRLVGLAAENGLAAAPTSGPSGYGPEVRATGSFPSSACLSAEGDLQRYELDSDTALTIPDHITVFRR